MSLPFFIPPHHSDGMQIRGFNFCSLLSTVLDLCYTLPSTPSLSAGECYRQNHPDRTNLRILNLADNKDLHGGEFSESLTLVLGPQLEMKINPPLPTHSSNNVCLCTLEFKPRLTIRLFCLPVLFAPSPRHYFFASIVILFPPRRRTNERTSKRTNER
jgi:hypothetical protein